MDYKERELTAIANTLKSIDRSLKEMMEISRANHAAPPVGDDCSRCFCSTCTDRLTCKLKPDEIMPGIYGSPCNGCSSGQRFMPLESKRCPKYVEGDVHAVFLQSPKHGVGV